MPLISVKPLKTSIIKIGTEQKKPLVRSLSSLRNKFYSVKSISSRKLKDTESVLQVLQPMHKLLWFFAPVPYDITKVNGIVKAIEKVNSKLYYLVYLVIGITTMSEALMAEIPDNIRTAITQINVVATNILFIALHFHKKGTVKTLNKIAELDRQLIKLGYRIKYKFYIYLLRIVIVTEVLLRLTMKKLDFLNFSVTEGLHNLLNTFIGLITGFYFCYIVICIMLTNNMLKNLNTYLLYVSNSTSTETRITNIKIVRRIYSDFWHITRCLNLNFNIIIAITCGICFINSITSVYVWWQDYSPITMTEMFQWIVIHIAKLIVLSVVCNTTKEEGEKMSTMLYSMYEKAFNEDKHEAFTIHQFLQQMMHEKIEYRACEMFPINKTFICSVVVVGTMNSILLLQLGVSKVQPQSFIYPHKN